jgi:hypothetical protein
MSLETMAEGARRLVELADEIDAVCGLDRDGNPRIVFIDIGGGLSVNYYGDEVSPTFDEYSTALQSIAPRLFSKSARTVCTGYRQISVILIYSFLCCATRIWKGFGSKDSGCGCIS